MNRVKMKKMMLTKNRDWQQLYLKVHRALNCEDPYSNVVIL